MISGFLLGLSSGTICLAYCVPVFLPYMLGEGHNLKKGFLDLLLFLGGRLAGYLAFAVLAWKVNHLFLAGDSMRHSLVLGSTYLILALLMITYAFYTRKTNCAAESFGRYLNRVPEGWLPAVLGLLTGINLCPPFLLAVTNAAVAAQLLDSIVYFTTFFVGTLIYFIPFPIIGLLGRYPGIQVVGRLTSGVIGGYYFYRGCILLLGGLMS